MRIVTYKKVKEFVEKDSNVSTALYEWYHKVKRANWNNLLELKKEFNNVDYIGNERYVFNIKGNHYRIVCIVFFASKKVYIRFIGAYAEYDKIIAKTI
ncbi:MAG: type II toxin-antitoxin system HigB family toxin [Chlorobi bacterium]|nr:type II toxin-antitoxin system HigB family toxin [Chlorobiota bacterium]